MPKPTPREKQLEWKEKIRQQQESDLSIEKWCFQNEIRSHTFQYLNAKLFPKPLNRSSFSEVNLKRDSALAIECRGLRLRIDKECNPLLRKQRIIACSSEPDLFL